MTQNSINNRASQLTIDPGASGDSFVQYDINGTAEFRIGVDDDDGDAFKISQGSALGSNNVLDITSGGIRTWPLTCVAKYINNTDRLNVTGDGTSYTMIFDSSRFDRNSNLSSFTTFTAPETGIYLATGCLRLEGMTSSHTDGIIQFTEGTVARNIRSKINPYAIVPSGGTLSVPINGITNYTAGETVTLDITVSGGTKVVDSTGRNDGSFMAFYLIG